jgi:hypothetical protein
MSARTRVLFTGLCASKQAYRMQPLKSGRGNQNGNMHLDCIHVEWHSCIILLGLTSTLAPQVQLEVRISGNHLS